MSTSRWIYGEPPKYPPDEPVGGTQFCPPLRRSEMRTVHLHHGKRHEGHVPALPEPGNGAGVDMANTVKREQVERLDFGEALRKLRMGDAIARKGWNGKGQYLELQQPDPGSKMTLPYVYIRTVDGDLVPWLASQTDLLAFDWCIVRRVGDAIVYGDPNFEPPVIAPASL